MGQNELLFTPQPAIPAYLIPEDGVVEAMFLGKTKVSYQFPDRQDYIPGRYQITGMEFSYVSGKKASVEKEYANGKLAEDLRNGKIGEIKIQIET